MMRISMNFRPSPGWSRFATTDAESPDGADQANLQVGCSSCQCLQRYVLVRHIFPIQTKDQALPAIRWYKNEADGT